MEGRLTVILVVLSLVFLGSCEEHKEHTAPAVRDRDSASMMVSYGVNTLISDSGVIKYKIVTERWDVNTVKQPTRWTFDKGIFLEQFDEKFHVEGYITADTAWYYDQLKLWELRGRVHIRNVNGLISTGSSSTAKNCSGTAYAMSSIPISFPRSLLRRELCREPISAAMST